MAARWIKISVLYLLLGIGFGFFMHLNVDLRWAATHGHINVVGWLSTGVMGAIYASFPRAAESALGKLHFWTYNIGLPFLLVGMLIIQLGPSKLILELLIMGGGGLMTLGVIAFALNMFANVKVTDGKPE